MIADKSQGQITWTQFPLPIRYEPVRPGVVWATENQEVPEFDWTRGFAARTLLLSPKDWKLERKRRTIEAVPDGLNYPRLVRKSPFELSRNPFDFEAPSVLQTLFKLSNKLPPLEEKSVDTGFARAVLQAVEEIGLLDPEGVGDSLVDWKLAASEAKTWIGFRNQFLMEEPKVRPNLEKDIPLFLFDEDLKNQGYENYLVHRLGSFCQTEEEPRTYTEWRKLIAANLTAEFLNLAGPFHVRRNKKLEALPELKHHKGARIWLLAEVAQMFSTDALHACQNPRCRRSPIFVPTHGNAKYCSSSCEEATRKRRARQKAK